ncbi:MAG: hypothetical protein MJY99_03700, partial [Fibrobacter sp.]|nr:hypothetical protein [Fibrobacter sp.]
MKTTLTLKQNCVLPLWAYFLVMAALLLCACSEDKTAGGSSEDENTLAIVDKTITGVSQKGPFLRGSTVTANELKDGKTLKQTGASFSGTIRSDDGLFDIKSVNLASQYAYMVVNGFYRNEVTGEESCAPVSLQALTDLSKRSEANINLLTHLEYERVVGLVTQEGYTVHDAKQQAESEILKAFYLDMDLSKNFEDLNILAAGDGNAALLAISIMMQGNLNEAKFSVRLADFAQDLEADGTWDDESTKAAVADWTFGANYALIRSNVEGWKLGSDVPAFEKYLKNYWWHNFGLGDCSKKNRAEVKSATNKLSAYYGMHFTCDADGWRVATDLEKDTYKWDEGSKKSGDKCKDGNVMNGKVNDSYVYVCHGGVWQIGVFVDAELGGCTEDRSLEVAESSMGHVICRNENWEVATDYEKDTYKWKDGKDGDSKAGSVNSKNCYVFEDNAWRSGNASDCSLGLRGCTQLRQDTVGLGSDKVWHICDAKSWRNATTYEKDTFGWADSTDGAIKKGNVTDSVYVFDKDFWRVTSAVEAVLGGCVEAIKDSVGKVDGTYYICRNKAWTAATAIEYDTYRWADGKDGDSKAGSVNSRNCYVFEDNAWRSGNANDCSLGLRGCTQLRQDTVGLGSDKVWHICDARNWREATDIEKDTATWGAGSFDGEVRVGQINENVYYIYENADKHWRNATTLEKDTYDYEANKDWSAGYDGEIKKGAVTDSVYVYDATAWRTTDAVESALGGCVSAIKDSVGKVGNTYYICTPRKWVIATALQYDTYHWNDTTDGAWRKGDVVSTNIYVFDEVEGSWRASTTEFDTLSIDGCTTKRNKERVNDYDEENEKDHYYVCYNKKWYDGNVWTWDLPKDVYLNPEIKYDEFTDERDGKVYKSVKIGDQVWMAENLNYSDSVATPSLKGKSWCHSNMESRCNVAGRLYTWAAAIDSVYIYDSLGVKCGSEKVCNLTEPLRGICPKGWHLPSSNECNELLSALNGANTAVILKAKIGWTFHNGVDIGIDSYGFSALPVSDRDLDGYFYPAGISTYFWSASQFLG